MPSLFKQIKKIFRSDSKKDSKKATASAAATTKPTAKDIVPAAAATTVVAEVSVAPVVEVAQTSTAPSHPENTQTNHTFTALVKSDAQLAALADHQYTKPVSAERVNAAKAGLEANGFKVHLVNSRGEAFETLKSLIPAGVSLNNAHSTTLEEIGFITYLKGET